MSDDHDTQPVRPGPAKSGDPVDPMLPADQPAADQPAAASAVPAAAPVAVPRRRLRDRAYGFRSVAAVALAGLVLGGMGGAAIGAAVGHDRDDVAGNFRGGFGDHGPGGRFDRP